MPGYSTGMQPSVAWPRNAAFGALQLALRPLQALIVMPMALLMAALTAMLLRPPDVPFYEIDRVVFALLVAGVVGRAIVARQRFWTVERASWPMIGLTLLAVTSVMGQPFDNGTWSLLAAKFIVPFTLFHLSVLLFRDQRRLALFELFALALLAYLSLHFDHVSGGRKVIYFSTVHPG